MKKKLLEVIRTIASDLYDVSAIDAKTMRKFDAMCLPSAKRATLSRNQAIEPKNHKQDN